MTLRSKAIVGVVWAGAIASIGSTPGHPSQQWIHFFVYLVAILLSSGMKVAMPKSEGTMSVNFPFILLGILQLSPLQAVILATSSVIAQCRFRVTKTFTLVQILFNVANVATATVLAWHTYAGVMTLHTGVAPALAVASTVYFFANTIPVTLIIASESGSAPFNQWRQDVLWYLPFYLVGAMLAALANLVGILFGWMTSLLLIPMVYTVYRAYRAQMAIVRDREQHIVEIEALHLRTIEALAMAVEAKDQNTHRHLMRVRVYVMELGKIMGLDKPMMQALTSAAVLHDIGKLAVPEHIINKPGKLTQEEFEKMKIHPVVGAKILERVHFPYPVIPIVRSHHEAWDGSGYPDGLRGEEIPIGARILTVVDCFDALASERPYRRAIPIDEAMAFVKERAGAQFDPAIVKLLEARYCELEELASKHIEEMQPLKTDLLIQHGAAPGNGFEFEKVDQNSAQNGEPTPNQSAEALAAKHNELLNIIVAASQEAKAIFELSQMLGSSLSAREISAMMSRLLQRLMPFDCFAIYLKSEEQVVTQYKDGLLAHVFSSLPILMGEGLSGWVAHNERPIVNGNPTVEPNYLVQSCVFTKNSSALSVPLFDQSGVVFGVLSVYSALTAAFSKDHLRILQAIQSQFSLALQNSLRFPSAENNPNIDQLTQLSTMRHFFSQVDAEIQKARNTGQHFGVALCDLNSFKALNDRHGYLIGDKLLRAIADGFRGCCSPTDTIARMGGDEFAFLFPTMKALSTHRTLQMLEAAVQRACAELHIEDTLSSSFGTAFYPEDGASTEELLGKADRAMYLRKQQLHYGNHDAPPTS